MVAAEIGCRSRFVVGSRTVGRICWYTPGAIAAELVFRLAYQRSAKVAAETTMPSVSSALQERVECGVRQAVRCEEVEDEDVGVCDDLDAHRCSMSAIRSDLASSSATRSSSTCCAAGVPASAPRTLLRVGAGAESTTIRRWLPALTPCRASSDAGTCSAPSALTTTSMPPSGCGLAVLLTTGRIIERRRRRWLFAGPAAVPS